MESEKAIAQWELSQSGRKDNFRVQTAGRTAFLRREVRKSFRFSFFGNRKRRYVTYGRRRGKPMSEQTPWRTAKEAADRMRVSTKTLYRLVSEGKVRAAVVGGRRSLRFRDDWIDSALEKMAEACDAA